MSYMDHNAAFSGEIQELNFEEIEEVNGGLGALVGAVLVVGAVIVVAFAVGVAAGYFAND